MSSEIKFRAWSGEAQRMIDNDHFQALIDGRRIGLTQPLLHNQTDTSSTIEIHEYIGNPFRERALEVMRCTDLRDRNGAEIYEGDILEGLPQGAVKGWVEVLWLSDLSGFKLRHGLAYWDLYRDRAKDLEVIGNIYENPELLECS